MKNNREQGVQDNSCPGGQQQTHSPHTRICT